MSKIFVTSDLHLDHVNVIQYCNRPYYSIGEMNEDFIRRWNEVVTDQDTVYILGDLSLSANPVERLLPRLQRKTLHLVAGNHDKCLDPKGYGFRQQWYDFYLECGFDSIKLADQIEIGGYLVSLCHFPYYWSQDPTPKFLKYRLKEDKNTILLYGHTHEKTKYRKPRGTLQIHVGVDAWNYYPVSEDQILEIIKEHR